MQWGADRLYVIQLSAFFTAGDPVRNKKIPHVIIY